MSARGARGAHGGRGEPGAGREARGAWGGARSRAHAGLGTGLGAYAGPAGSVSGLEWFLPDSVHLSDWAANALPGDSALFHTVSSGPVAHLLPVKEPARGISFSLGSSPGRAAA